MRLDTRYLLFILAILSVGAHSQGIFSDEPYIQVIKEAMHFQAVVITSDWLTSFVFYRDDSQRSQVFAPSYMEFAREFHDFVKPFAVDCEAIANEHSNVASIPICNPENAEYLPAVTFFEPAQKKINPYTKKPMQPVEHHFQGDASAKALFNFGRQFMPAWRETIKNKEQLEKFLNDEQVPSKVVLFTNKAETSPLYKAITSAFRDRILFSEVHEKVTDLVQEYEVTKFPTIYVVTREADGTLTKELYQDEIKFDKISKFLDKYALKQKVQRPVTEEAEAAKDQGYEKAEKQEKPEAKITFHPTSHETFLQDINKHEKLVMVHVFKDEEFEILKDVTEKFGSLFEYFSFNCKNEIDEKYAHEVLNIKSFPALIVFPVGKEKKLNNRLHLPKFKVLPEILHDISDLIEDKTQSLSPADAQIYINELVVSRKPTFILFYDTQDVSMSYRVIAQLSKYQGKMRFAKFKNPNQETKTMFQISKLPTLVVLFLQDPNKEAEEIKNEDVKVAHYSGRYVFNELSKFVDAFLPQEELLQEMNIKKKVHEVQVQDDFDRLCPPEAKACIIGLLNGYQGTEEARNRFNESLDALNHALKKYPQFPFIWIDAVCHSELLIDLNIMSEMVPTLVIYNPGKKEFSQLIGQYDKNGLTQYIERYFKGRAISSYKLPQGFKIQKRDCEQVHQSIIEAEKQSGLSPEDTEILKEILEEERKKKEAMEGDKKKGKKKGKKGKKANDEL